MRKSRYLQMQAGLGQEFVVEFWDSYSNQELIKEFYAKNIKHWNIVAFLIKEHYLKSQNQGH